MTTHAPVPPPSDSPVSALASGLAHADAGRWREAVAELTRVQRAHSDPGLAHRLVRLRHDAALQITPTADAPALWPPVLPDPFPGVAAPPEIGPGELSAATLGGAIVHHGCLIVRGFEAEERAVALRSMVVRAIEARDRSVAGEPHADDGAWYQPFEPGGRVSEVERRWVQEAGGMLVADAPTVMCELLEVLEGAGATAAIAEYLGEAAAVSFNKCVLRKVRRSNAIWHQDGSFMGAGVRAVDVWLSLSHCGPGTDAPGIDIVPKRVDEVLATQTHGASYSIAIGQGLVDEVSAGAPAASPVFAPGDAINFDDRFVHRSASGEGCTADRYAIESWFFAASHFPEAYQPILA